MRLVLTIPLSDDTSDATSIDDVAKKYGTVYQGRGVESSVQHVNLDPVTEFQGHCSNIQAWVENDYDTRLLHSNLSFSLLKALSKVNDDKAKRVLAGELHERLKAGSATTRIAILESCGDLLDQEMFDFYFDQLPLEDKSRFFMNLGIAVGESDDPEKAIDFIYKATIIDPSNAEAWLQLGNAKKRKGDLKGAIDAYHKAFSLKPDDNGIVLHIGDALKQSGDGGAIEREIIERVENGSTDSIVALMSSIGHIVDDARFKILVDGHASTPEKRLYAWIGRLVSFHSSEDEASTCSKIYSINECLEIEPKSVSFFLDTVLEIHRHAGELDLSSYTAWDKLGTILQRSMKYVESIDAYILALKKLLARFMDKSRTAITRQDAAYMEAKNEIINHLDASYESLKMHIPDDMDSIKKMIESGAYLGDTLCNLAWTLDESGNKRGAIEAYHLSLKYVPTDASVWNSLSCIFTTGGALPAGITDDEKPAILSDAIEAAKKAISLDPGCGLYHTTLGEALEASGDVDKAIIEYEKALELDPKEDYAKEYLQRLGRLAR
ncbi:MAG: tetratricopeptide repeat protein [Candidatus Sigynarchaeota archaeon]